jgi:uncharacterized protein
MCIRIREHVIQHNLSCIDLALHGGEPLLRKLQFFEEASTLAKTILSPICELNIGVQTNAVLLSDEYLDVFYQHKIVVGVSLDGPIEVNDKFRIYKNGRGSYKKAIKGISKLSEGRNREIWGGLLAVIDVESEPLYIYRQLSYPRQSRGFIYVSPSKGQKRDAPKGAGSHA